MAHLKIALGTLAAALLATAATAQTNTIIQPVGEFDQNIVRAQFIKPGDVSPEEYQRLLDEADKIRAFQNIQGAYTNASETAPSDNGGQFMTDSYGYKIELFDATSTPVTSTTTRTVNSYPMATTYATTPMTTAGTTITATAPVVTYQAAPVSTTRASHYVVKGDTLYNIANRNSISVDQLKSANGLSSNALQLGQTLSIPGKTISSYSAPMMAPVTTASTMATTQTQPIESQRSTTLVRNVEPIPTSNIYAVLPKDTLYSISRRSCVSVDIISSLNGLSDPSTIQPGQRLSLPNGHCLK